MDQMIGKHIDTYQIQEVLGRGGMGVVYKGIDTSLERDVAIKMMDVMIASDPNFLKRFQSEAKALAKLQNPNIVTVFALRETEFGVCIVMEFVKGKTLADLLKQGHPLPIPRVVTIFKQVCSALDHAHRENVIHRDIKPGNIMLAEGDVVKVTDFGLAKIQKNAVSTMTMGTAGTLYYMSPEQIRGLGNVDNRGDIYSAGMALYESLTGRVPFNPEDPDFVIAQSIVEGKIMPVDKMNPGVPKELAKIVMRSIDKDPAKRFQTAAEMAQALERFGNTLKPGEYAVSQAATMIGMPPIPIQKKLTRQIVQKSSNKTVIISVAAAVVLVITYFVLRPTVFPDEGHLSVRTQPPGARIFVDNALVNTPAGDEFAVSSGKRKVSVTWGPDRLDTVISIDGGSHIALTLLQRRAPAAIKTPNEGGQPAGGTQGTDRNAAASEHLARDVEVTAMGTLGIDVAGSGEVSVDGAAYRSVSGRTDIQVPAGSRNLVFHRGGMTAERSVFVGNGRTEIVKCYFEGEVNVVCFDGGKLQSMAIVVDGVKREEFTAATIKLPAGVHKIGAARMGWVMDEQPHEIRIKPSFERAQPVKVSIKVKKQ